MFENRKKKKRLQGTAGPRPQMSGAFGSGDNDENSKNKKIDLSKESFAKDLREHRRNALRNDGPPKGRSK